jgi:hypothetical protein
MATFTTPGEQDPSMTIELISPDRLFRPRAITRLKKVPIGDIGAVIDAALYAVLSDMAASLGEEWAKHLRIEIPNQEAWDILWRNGIARGIFVGRSIIDHPCEGEPWAPAEFERIRRVGHVDGAALVKLIDPYKKVAVFEAVKLTKKEAVEAEIGLTAQLVEDCALPPVLVGVAAMVAAFDCITNRPAAR